MELTKTKYKQTEVGLIPEDWDIKYIDEVVNISTGSKNTQDKVDDGEYPFYVRSQTVERINSYSYDCEAVLTVGDGVGTGKVFHYVNHKFELHQRVYIMNEFSSNLNGYYFYLFFSQNFYDRVMQMTAKSSVDSVRREMIAGMKIPLPPLPEQKAIAEVLSDTDSLIHAIEQKLAKKRAIKQGAMQKLLTPKEDWEVKKLGDILNSFRLGSNYPNSETLTRYPLIKMGNILRGKITLSKLEYISENSFVNEQDLLKRGDVLFNTRNTLDLVGKVAIWNNELPVGYYNSNIMKFEFDNSVISSNRFMNYSFNTKRIISNLRNIATGTTSVAAIYTRDLLNVEFYIPAKDEQTRIATILSDIDKEIELIEKQLAKYQVLKQGLMQELLTGKIRLTV